MNPVVQPFRWWSYLRTRNAEGGVAYTWVLGNEQHPDAIASALLTADALRELNAACVFLFGNLLIDECASSVDWLYRQDVLQLDVNRPRLVQRAVAYVIAQAAIELARTSARMFPQPA